MNQTTDKALNVRGATKTYGTQSGGIHALKDVDLTVRQGEFISIVGPSGCGKTTLLWSIAGLHRLTSGAIALGDEFITGPHPSIGMMFQEANLLPWRSIRKNIELPFEIRKRRPDAARIEGLLEGEDVIDTARAMRAFGAEVTNHGQGRWSVHGVGVGGFVEPSQVIDCGNSGTGVRLAMGLMATTPLSATCVGDASLSKRPMGRVTVPLSAFGTRFETAEGNRLPLTIHGARNPVPV